VRSQPRVDGTHQRFTRVQASGGPFITEGGGSANSRERFDIGVALYSCGNAFTGGDDVIEGTAAPDVLCGGDGDDTIGGKGGNDRGDKLDGGSQADLLRARDRKRDRVRGGPGRDTALVDGRDLVAGVEVVRN
jgi:Ca2+-binding RTX toxin-like protein